MARWLQSWSDMNDVRADARPVRALQIESQGEGMTRAVLFCPDRGETRDLETCLTCERFDHLEIDGQRRTLLIRCHHLGPPGTEAPPTPLGDVMGPLALCVQIDTHFEEIRRMFIERGASAAAVVDARARPVGMVTKTDLLEPRRGARAKDLMMPFVFSLPETAPVSQAAALMAAEGIHQVAVVAPDGALLGLVTSLDVMRWLARREGWLTQPRPNAM